MIYAKSKFYKLTEFHGGLVITERDDGVKDPSAKPLCAADAATLMTYLDRYFFEREHGSNLHDAHKAALQTAQIHNIETPPQ